MSVSCVVCEEAATIKCEGSGKLMYCENDHKKSNSSLDKTQCKPYRVEKNSKYGRYLVTSRNVRKGELLLRETPLLVGLRVDSVPSCLECFTPLYSPNSRCRRCGVSPLCPDCRHSPLECEFLSGLSVDQKQLFLKANHQHLLPLRILLHLKRPGGDERFRQVLDMEAHLEARRGTDVWCSHHENVVKLFKACGLISSDREDSDLVQKVCGILDVNSFEVRGAAGRLRGVFLEAALMAHNCVTNVHLSVDDNFLMTIRASVDIPEGEPIMYNYTDPLQTTSERQKHLREGKYFVCECRRCTDPAELGSYVSSLWCPRCKIGRVLAIASSSGWTCESCKHSFSSGLMSTTVTVARNYIDSLDRSDAAQLEQALARLSSTFPPSNSLMLDLKQSIVAVYREQRPTRAALLRKVELCKELLHVLRKIELGISRLIGITLYELHVALVTLAQEPGSSEVADQLRQAEEVLKEALTLLLYEPPASPEGELARQAMQELKTLKHLIAKQEAKDKKKKSKGKHKK